MVENTEGRLFLETRHAAWETGLVVIDRQERARLPEDVRVSVVNYLEEMPGQEARGTRNQQRLASQVLNGLADP